jgi:S-adenosylmethionine:tRNA ribosyltransferase-isomerase
MKLSEFDYLLPKELIAQQPSEKRDDCRLMVLDRKTRSVSHRRFNDIAGFLKKDDLLILNDTKVIPARIFGKRRTGGKVEIFLLEKKGPICEALVRPSGRLKEGEIIELESGDEVEVLSRGEAGRFVKFNGSIDEILGKCGHMPLPPYIGRDDRPEDKNYYQTVYAKTEGATASPTAGLHFTTELLEGVRGQGSRVQFVTLHTNYGTFAPIKCENVEDHKMHKEFFDISAETIDAISQTKARGGKVFAVGTTSNRVMEYCAGLIGSRVQGPGSRANGYTDLFIYPGYEFKVTDHLITNFHLPGSTLLLLVAAFAGKDFILEAYQKAIEEKYRFFSYGDAMLIL